MVESTSSDGAHASEEQYSRGRRLFGVPVLLQDWDDETEEGAFQYWELFLDLLLVAAASSITDQFKDSQELGEFVVFYMIILNGWLLYTHHITLRFQDNSLAHSMVLFVYCIGFGYEIVNAGYEYTRVFCYGAVLQRFSVLTMLASIACAIPRARAMCAVIGSLTTFTTILLLVVGIGLKDAEDKSMKLSSSPVLFVCFWAAALLEFCGEAFMMNMLSGRRMIPVNIDQTKERLGAMELVMLGESVLSVCIIYREFQAKRELEEGVGGEDKAVIRFYYVLGFSFLLIFMFLLLYFHMQPSPTDHAFRRSRFHGTALLILHKVLGLTYLAVGTATKLIVEDVLEDQPEKSALTTQLMGYGVGASILVMFGMRYLHYGGRGHINFGTQCLYFGVDPHLDRLANTWWATVFLAGILPILGTVSGWTTQFDPIALLGIHAGWVFLLVLMESSFSHALQDGATKQNEQQQQQHGETLPANEATGLIQKG